MKMNKTLEAGCPFCDAEIGEATFAESNHFRAVYNISPILPGHSLVIPKWHIGSLLELGDEELGEMMVFAREVVRTLLTAFHARAFDWTIQEGAEAGQTVPHLHLHLLPRMEKDLPHPGGWYPLLQDNITAEAIDSEGRLRISKEEMDQIVRHLRGAWRNNS